MRGMYNRVLGKNLWNVEECGMDSVSPPFLGLGADRKHPARDCRGGSVGGGSVRGGGHGHNQISQSLSCSVVQLIVQMSSSMLLCSATHLQLLALAPLPRWPRPACRPNTRPRSVGRRPMRIQLSTIRSSSRIPASSPLAVTMVWLSQAFPNAVPERVLRVARVRTDAKEK